MARRHEREFEKKFKELDKLNAHALEQENTQVYVNIRHKKKISETFNVLLA
jgi:hypothetical protein